MGNRKPRTANREPQFAVTRLQFHVTEISNFSKAFSSVQFVFIQPKDNTIQEYLQELEGCEEAQKKLEGL